MTNGDCRNQRRIAFRLRKDRELRFLAMREREKQMPTRGAHNQNEIYSDTKKVWK